MKINLSLLNTENELEIMQQWFNWTNAWIVQKEFCTYCKQGPEHICQWFGKNKETRSLKDR